ncbi:MAG: histidinol-phosphate transaminase [Gammaproteobacteria bacterium]|nr:MAG: histidinol-phosphate transaminase [Gammaproteobacteria bacterium]
MNETPEARIRALVRAELHALTPYHVPPSEGFIKLDAMENPYGLPKEVKDALLERLRAVPLNRYPDPAARALKARLRDFSGLDESFALLLGNGSDEILQMLLLAVRRGVMAPEPSFSMYPLISAMVGVPYRGVPLREDFSLDVPAMLEAMAAEKPGIVFLASPNNPTGNAFPLEAIEAIVKKSPGLVVVDEAYIPFGGASALQLLPRHPHLLVLRTLSKLGLAGLRLGWIMGHPAWIEVLEKVRLPYNINSLTQAGAAFALEHREVFAAQIAAIKAERERLYRALLSMGFEVYPSAANFILFRAPGRGESLFEALKRQKVLVKCLHGSHPLLADCLRVTVGLPEENDAFLRALRHG